ncbi:MAG: hypothetical protein RL461_471, partial [Planctomycetota bacterium]
MTQMLIRAAWALVLALSVLPVGRHAVAQSQFPTALTSSEFEALLPRLGVPDAQRAAAMAEYDRYQRATSELRSGAIERYLKDQPGGGALFAMGDDDRPADEVRNRVRTYRSLLAQWDTLENALVDSLPALGADAITVDRVRRSMELRRIEQSTADGFMMRLGSQADLWAIAERSTKDLDPTQRTLIDDRIAAREAEYVEAVRAVRTAAFNQPELLLELKAKANADHPQPSAETMRQQMEQAQEQGGELDPSGFSKGFEAHFRAMAAAFQQSREPVQTARLRATRLGAGILRDAFQGIPQPRGASAWLAFVRASGSGSFGIDDGGAIRLVESMVAKAQLTPEQDQAVAAAFDAWQTAVLAALDGQGPLAFIDAGAEEMQATIRKREEAAQARTAALKAGVRSALGLPPEAEAVAQDAPDGGEREQGAPVNVAVRVGVAIADGEVGDGDVAVGGNAVVLDMAGEGLEVGDEGGPMLWQGAGRPAIQPLGKQDLQVILELCGPADSVKPVIEQMHADYLEVAGAVTAQLDAAPSAQMSFGPDGPKSPSKDDIAAKYDAIRTAFAAMERADADFFADLAAVVDEACVRQQAQYRARELARAAAGGAGSSIGFGMVGGAGSGPFVDPESVIRAAVTDGAIDAAAASMLRGHVAAQGHDAILAALRNQVEV